MYVSARMSSYCAAGWPRKRSAKLCGLRRPWRSARSPASISRASTGSSRTAANVDPSASTTAVLPTPPLRLRTAMGKAPPTDARMRCRSSFS